MLTKTKIAGLMTALMVLSAPVVWADGGDMKDGQHWQHGQMMAKILNLSDDQAKQLQDSKQKQRDAKKALFEQMKTNREAFEAEIVKAAPDMSKVNDIQTKIKALQSQMVDDHLNAILEIKKIMSPEQFAGYMALEKEEDMMKHMMGHEKFGHREWSGKDGDHDSEGQE